MFINTKKNIKLLGVIEMWVGDWIIKFKSEWGSD